MRKEARQLSNEKLIEKKIVYISLFICFLLKNYKPLLNKREIK